MHSFVDLFFSWKACVFFSVSLVLLLLWEYFDKSPENVGKSGASSDTPKEDPFGLIS